MSRGRIGGEQGKQGEHEREEDFQPTRYAGRGEKSSSLMFQVGRGRSHWSDLFTHLFTRSLARSLTLAHSLTHAFTHSLSFPPLQGLHLLSLFSSLALSPLPPPSLSNHCSIPSVPSGVQSLTMPSLAPPPLMPPSFIRLLAVATGG